MDGFESDRRSLRAKLDVDRREMLAASLAAGFAAAVRPVAAQTVIHTDSEGLEAGEVSIPAGDRDIPAYRAMPAKSGTFPVILVVQEIFGVHEHIKDVCRRLAKQGYMAIAPELYARQGNVAEITDVKDIIAKVVSKVPDAQVMADLDATVAWAEGIGQGRHRQARHHRLLLGRAHRLALRGAQPASSRPASPGTAGSSATARRIRRATRSISPPSSRRRCSASTAARTRASRSKRSSGCARRAKPPASNARSSSTRIRRTASTPTTARATVAEAAKDGVGAHARLVPRPRRHLSGPQSFRHNRRLDIPTAHKGLPVRPCN